MLPWIRLIDRRRKRWRAQAHIGQQALELFRQQEALHQLRRVAQPLVQLTHMVGQATRVRLPPQQRAVQQRHQRGGVQRQGLGGPHPTQLLRHARQRLRLGLLGGQQRRQRRLRRRRQFQRRLGRKQLGQVEAGGTVILGHEMQPVFTDVARQHRHGGKPQPTQQLAARHLGTILGGDLHPGALLRPMLQDGLLRPVAIVAAVQQLQIALPQRLPLLPMAAGQRIAPQVLHWLQLGRPRPLRRHVQPVVAIGGDVADARLRQGQGRQAVQRGQVVRRQHQVVFQAVGHLGAGRCASRLPSTWASNSGRSKASTTTGGAVGEEGCGTTCTR